MNDIQRGTWQMSTAMVLSGLIGWFVMLSGQPVTAVVFWRCLFGAASLLVVCLAMGLLRPGAITRGQAMLAIAGGVALVGNWLLLFAAYPRASIGIATAVYNTQPFMLVALGAVFFAERLTAYKIAWLLMGFTGTVLVAQGAPGEASGSNYVGGIALALGAAFLYAVAAIIAKRLTGVRPHLIALIQVSVGALLLAPLMDFSSLPTSGVSWAALLTIGLVNTGLMYILLYGAIQRLPTHLTAALSFIYPVVAIAVDVIVFDHRFGVLQAVGSAAILLSAAAMTVGPSLLAARARYTARRAECEDKIVCAKP